MEVSATHRRVVVQDPSQSSSARYTALEAANVAAFGDEDAYRVGLVATELATNLVKYATGGELLIRVSGQVPVREVEVMSVDRGPGMGDVWRCLVDGYSTSDTPGNGLGGVRRLSDDFDIYSEAGRGTVVLSRIRARQAPRPVKASLELAGVSLAMHGETLCGDAWQVYHHAGGTLAVVADGLGHGVYASEASTAAIGAIDAREPFDLPRCLERMHESVRHTRGAAVALTEISPDRGLMAFAGIGNISAVVTRMGAVRHAVSLNGTLGHEARQFRGYSYPWGNDAMLVMHSDGLGTHWSIDDYRGLRQRHPAIVAAVLYRDFSRHRDDVTVLVGREAA